MQHISKLLLSIAISIGLLAILIRFTLSSAEPSLWSSLVAVLLSFPFVYASFYLVVSLVKTGLQSWRFKLLIEASETASPSLFHIYLVTLSRNMFVDMLPARIGELSYIAMLNRGCRVRAESCVSSLVIAFVFDLIALGILLLVLLVVQVVGGDFQRWMVGAVIMLAVLIGFMLVLLYPTVKLVNRIIGKTGWFTGGLLSKARDLLLKIQQALDATRAAGITGRLTLISVGVRISKYLALYGLFIGVVSVQYPEMTTSIARVLPALVSAEAGASLPVPAFMGFGTYEAGGTLALTALGASASVSLIVMLAVHVISQIVDYGLGGAGLILFLFTAGSATDDAAAPRRKAWLYWIPIFLLTAAAVLFLIVEMRAVKKRGTLKSPASGRMVAAAKTSLHSRLPELDGFIVWSSNRSGNHDIYLRPLSGETTRRLTSHPHTEYFPRISPDGSRIVFARSHEPWVSQRNVFAWDVWLLDIGSGKERLLAKNGNVPTWSADGNTVYFQRNAVQVVAFDLKTGSERVLYQSGVSVDVPPKTELQTPAVGPDGRLAVTLRRAVRATAVVDGHGIVTKTGNGCQLNWGHDGTYLYKIDHDNRNKNALYRIDAATNERKIWFDAPGAYSHEYFPKVSNLGRVLVYGASSQGHEHDSADYEIFFWQIGEAEPVRITYHTGNDCWPDIFLR